MKIKRSANIWMFIWCLFMGVTAISIGFGALFPSMNRIAKPFVCPGGTMDLVKQVYNPYPGTTITTITWYCTSGSTGVRTELGIFPMTLYAGIFYGLLLYFILLLALSVLGRNARFSQSIKNVYAADPAEDDNSV